MVKNISCVSFADWNVFPINSLPVGIHNQCGRCPILPFCYCNKLHHQNCILNCYFHHHIVDHWPIEVNHILNSKLYIPNTFLFLCKLGRQGCIENFWNFNKKNLEEIQNVTAIGMKTKLKRIETRIETQNNQIETRNNRIETWIEKENSK